MSGTRKKKVTSIFVGLITGVIILVACFFLLSKYEIFPSIGNNDSKTLKTPINLKYDIETYTLSWDAVEDADTYYVNINNDEYENHEVKNNSFYYILKDDITDFKVKAIDSTGELSSSNWSKSYRYTYESDNPFTYTNLFRFVDGMFSARLLNKIIAMFVENEYLITYATFLNNGKLDFYRIRSKYKTPLSSIRDALEMKNEDLISHTIMHTYSTLPYDSATYFLQSNSYKGELEARRQEGYEFSVVSSQLAESNPHSGEGYIFATYKLSLDNEVKYVFSQIVIIVNEYNSNEEKMFTTDLVNPNKRTLIEDEYVELKGDEIDVAKVLEKANSQQNTHI